MTALPIAKLTILWKLHYLSVRIWYNNYSTNWQEIDEDGMLQQLRQPDWRPKTMIKHNQFHLTSGKYFQLEHSPSKKF